MFHRQHKGQATQQWVKVAASSCICSPFYRGDYSFGPTRKEDSEWLTTTPTNMISPLHDVSTILTHTIISQKSRLYKSTDGNRKYIFYFCTNSATWGLGACCSWSYVHLIQCRKLLYLSSLAQANGLWISNTWTRFIVCVWCRTKWQ